MLLPLKKGSNDLISHNLMPFCYLSYGVILIAIAVKGYDVFLQCDNVHNPVRSDWFSKAGYTPTDFVWFAVGTFFLPIGFIYLLISLVQFIKGGFSGSFKTLFMSAIFGLSLWCAIESNSMASDILDCGVFCFQSSDAIVAKANMTPAQVFIGLVYLFLSLSIVLLTGFVLIFLLLKQCGVVLPSPDIKSYHLGSIGVTFILVFPFLIFCTLALPDAWKDVNLKGIRSFQEEIPDPKYGFYWKIAHDNYPNLVLKLFPDVLFYYGFIYSILTVALLTHFIPRLKNIFHARMAILWRYTIGELMLGVLLLGLIIGEFLYYFSYVFVVSNHGMTLADQGSIAVGQTASVVLGLLLLPVTRNSIWCLVFGVSHSVAIKFHILLGILFLTLVIVHALLFWKVLAERKQFPVDIFSVPTVVHANNPTIPLIQLTIMVLFLVTAFPSLFPSIRKKNYELWYYLHHFFVVLFLVVLWHAHRSWYFITASLVLWVADHALRLMNCIGSDVSLVSLALAIPEKTEDESLLTDQGIVQISYEDISKNGSLKIEPGQYMYINLPSLSTLEWHPFTVSSKIDNIITHSIKSRGSQQWTGKLMKMAQNIGDSTGELKNIRVIVDGPYGTPLKFNGSSHVLLVAGGIGITPYASYLSHICNGHINNDKKYSNSTCKIRLIWIVKTMAEVTPFCDLICESIAIGVDIQVFVTQDNTIDELKTFVASTYNPLNTSVKYINPDTRGSFPVHRGRPDLKKDIEALEMYRSQALVAVCGPPSLVDNCCRLSIKVSFRSDLFEY